jgi:hypothetical protein
MWSDRCGLGASESSNVDDLALALATKDQVKPPPNYWYSYLFRGASAYIHPTSRGIEPVYTSEDAAFVVDTSTSTPERVMQMTAMLLSVQIGIASLATPWLIDPSELAPLQTLVDDQ